jgi:hypothetical protein
VEKLISDEVTSLSLLQMWFWWTIFFADIHSGDLKGLSPSLLVVEYIAALCDES